jgi:hypothetical protein
MCTIFEVTSESWNFIRRLSKVKFKVNQIELESKFFEKF